ncbi:MAG: LPXTG cell wall anchor domain-containing protein, partial [Lactobacillales bacterium]|nr:LPXTG cell wall anchor domain-containing protein [Lactobacillales bacterium]
DGIPGNSGFSSGGTDVDEVVSRSVGDPVTFEIDVPFPIDLHHVITETDANGEIHRRYLYDYLNLRDLPDTGLSFYEFDDIELGGESIYTWEKGVDSGLIGGLSFIVEYNNEDKYKATRSDMYIDVPDEVTDENTAKLEAMAGQTLVYTIIMLVNNHAPRETNINNVVGYNKVKNPYNESIAQMSYRSVDKGRLSSLGELQFGYAGSFGSKRQKNGVIQHYLTNLNKSYVSNDSSLVYKRDSKIDKPIFLLDPPRDPDNPESYGEEFEVDDSEYVIVFEKDFDKVKGGTNEKILNDTAAFVLKDEKERFYGGFDNRGLLHWIEITEEDKLTVEALLANTKVQKFYTTDDSTKDGKITGILDLPGLAKGNYEVVEVKAPAGYYIDKSVKGIKFEVGDDIASDPSNPSAGYGEGMKIDDAGIVSKIENFPAGILPSTGWRESIIFLVFGILIVSIAVYYFMKNKRAKNTRDVT